MSEPLLPAIDLGTSACKTVLFKPDRTTVALATADYPIHASHRRWAEQHPAEWWKAAVQAIRTVLHQSH